MTEMSDAQSFTVTNTIKSLSRSLVMENPDTGAEYEVVIGVSSPLTGWPFYMRITGAVYYRGVDHIIHEKPVWISRKTNVHWNFFSPALFDPNLPESELTDSHWIDIAYDFLGTYFSGDLPDSISEKRPSRFERMEVI